MIRICFLVITGLCIPILSLAQPELITDPTGKTQYKIPLGWEVQTQQENNVYVWTAAENPGLAESPSLMVIAMPDFEGSRPTLGLDILKSDVRYLQVLEQKVLSQDEGHFKVGGTVKNIPARLAVSFIRDPENARIFIAVFAGPTAKYQELGAENLLYQALQRANPFLEAQQVVSDNKDKHQYSGSEPVNMQDENVQNQIIQASIPIEKNLLEGKWLQVMAYQGGDAYQSVTDGTLRIGERGYGHILEFLPNDRYRLTYAYKSFYQGCDNQAQIVEVGAFSLRGRYLVLQPERYEGQFVTCGQTTPQTVENPPTREFFLSLGVSKQHLVVQGAPLEYTIATETDAQGRPFFKEGFTRTE